MSNVTKIEAARDTKAARQSVRAKIRKALAVPGADLSAADTKALEGVFASLNATLAAKAPAKATKAATTKAKPAKVKKARSPKQIAATKRMLAGLAASKAAKAA